MSEALNEGKLNYLELCNRVMLLTGELGSERLGSLQDFEDEGIVIPLHVESAWNEIARSRPDWRFLREDKYVTQYLRPGQNEQRVDWLLGDDVQQFSHWNETGVFQIEQQGVRLFRSALVPYDEIRSIPIDGVSGFPSYISIMANFNIFVWPSPSEGQKVRLLVDYFRRPKVLRQATDFTDLPAGFEDVVIYRALMHHFESEQGTFHRVHHEASYRAAKSNLQLVFAPDEQVYVPLYVD